MIQQHPFVSVLILLIIALHPSSNAKTYYVAPSGSDIASGTQSTPFASWAKAQTSVSAGDTVLFRSGTYAYTKALRACNSQTDNVNAIQLQWRR